MKVFISQPMNGRKKEDILRQRKELETETKKYILSVYGVDEVEKLEFFDTYFKTDNVNHLKCLAMSIDKMSEADLVVFSPDWSMARGCYIEHEIAKTYGIKMVHVTDKGIPEPRLYFGGNRE